MSNPKIVSIAACPIPGDRRTFANVYGVDDRGDVYQWYADEGRWKLHKFQPRNDLDRDRR